MISLQIEVFSLFCSSIMAWDSSSMGEHWEEITVRFDCYVSLFEKISNIVLSLIWVSFWKLYISYDLSVDKLGLFNKFVSYFWLPLFVITTALRLGYWIPRILAETSSYVSDHSGLIYRRRRLERFGFYIERIAMLLLSAPYCGRAIVFQFGCCAIPCLVIFPFANSFQLALWASHFLHGTILSSGRITEQDFMLMFLKNIFGLNDGDKNGELKKTHASTDPPARRLDLNDDDNNNNNNIPDLEESKEAGETVESEESKEAGETVESEESKEAGETVESEESKDAGETVESVESKDGGETEESESESDKVVLSGSEDGSFVMLELNKDEEELQDSSSVESREEQTETILEGKLGNNEEKQETKMFDLKKALQKTAGKSENSFGELIGKLRATESQAELYRLQAQETKENIRKLEEDRTDLILKLAAANASSELYRALLRDLE